MPFPDINGMSRQFHYCFINSINIVKDIFHYKKYEWPILNYQVSFDKKKSIFDPDVFSSNMYTI